MHNTTMNSVGPLLSSLNQLNENFDPFHEGPEFLQNQSAAELWTQQIPELLVDVMNGTTTSIPSKDDDSWYCEIAFNKVLIFTLCVFGFLSNFMTILVLRRDPNKNKAATIWLLQALAVVDNILLSFTFLQYSITTIALVTPWKSYLCDVCTLSYFLMRPMATTAHTITVWIVVLITADRYLAICKPMEIKWRSLRRMKLTFLWLLILSLLLNVPVLLTSTCPLLMEKCWPKYENTHAETTESSSRLTLKYLFQAADVFNEVMLYVVRIFGPLIILTILSVPIVFTLRAMKKKQRQMSLQIDRESAVIKMVAAVVGTFLLCQLPTTVIAILRLRTDVEFDSSAFHCARYLSEF